MTIASPAASPIELGMRVMASTQCAPVAAERIDDLVARQPWLRVAHAHAGHDGLTVHLVATLGSREAVKAAEPEVQVVLGGLVDLMDDLAPYEPCFIAPVQPGAPLPGPGAARRALRGEAA